MTELPAGFRVRIDPAVRRLDGGAALLGGSPTTLLRLKPQAAELIADGELTVTSPATAALARRFLDLGIAHPDLGPRPVAEVTVIVPVKDNQPGIDRLLKSLAQHVIVVDDGSAIPIQAPHVIRHAQCRGPAAARNTGLAAATTEFVVFIDSDAVPVAGWLAILSAHFADPTLALVAPRIISLGDPAGALGRYEQIRSSLDLGAKPGPVVPRSPVAYVPSAAMMVRRAALEDGFDESMHVAEDVDLCWRLHEAGWRLRYEPAAQVAHEHRTTLRTWLGRKAFYGVGAAPLAARHAGDVAPLVLAPWSAAAGVALLSGTKTGAVSAVAATGFAGFKLRRTLGGLAHPGRAAARLLAMGLGGALWQLASGICRHYWPLAVLVGLCSRRARRVIALVALSEGLADWATHDGPGNLDPMRYVLFKRLDDVGYGAGLWWGAMRARSLQALLPRVG
nr:mycofactocin biosynthesis glycosyltransferase MftF [Tomitella biformata]